MDSAYSTRFQSCGLSLQRTKPSASRRLISPLESKVRADAYGLAHAGKDLEVARWGPGRDQAEHPCDTRARADVFDHQAAITSVAECLSTPCVTPSPSLVIR